MKINTKLTKVSRNVKKQKGFINPGIYKGSTMIFNTFEEYINDLKNHDDRNTLYGICLLYTSPSPRDRQKSRMPSSA